jgi:hypothetical protein
MAALARTLSRASGVSIDTDSLRTLGAVAIFCGFGLFVSLLLASRGVDLGPGFF